MKPPPFRLAAPITLSEALELLAETPRGPVAMSGEAAPLPRRA